MSDHAHGHARDEHRHHDHGGHGHDHDHARGASESRLGLAALITALFMVAEILGGLVSGSLALLADAGHMATDVAALTLAWFAFRLARRPASRRWSYGFDRAEVLAAFINGLALFLIAAWIVVEAINRLSDPQSVSGGIVMAVAAAGLAVNIGVFLLLRSGNQDNLNIRGAALHVMGDLLGSVAALAAGLVIVLTGWTPIDPILSVLVALIILRSGWKVTAQSGHILLEATPAGYDPRALAREIVEAVDGIVEVHHVHIWSITEERMMATLHARIAAETEPERAVAEIKAFLAARHGLDHVTVEIERGDCADHAVRENAA